MQLEDEEAKFVTETVIFVENAVAHFGTKDWCHNWVIHRIGRFSLTKINSNFLTDGRYITGEMVSTDSCGNVCHILTLMWALNISERKFNILLGVNSKSCSR